MIISRVITPSRHLKLNFQKHTRINKNDEQHSKS